MKKKGLTNKALGTFVGVLTGAASFGVNLQTFVLGAETITEESTELKADTEYCVGDAKGFLQVGKLVQEGQVAKSAKIKLTTDIDLSAETSYTPVGSSEKPFMAKFDGNNKKLTLKIDTKITDKDACVGVFGCVGKEGEVGNLVISEESSIKVEVAGEKTSENTSHKMKVLLQGATIDVPVRAAAGGVAGVLLGKIHNCSNKGTVAITVSDTPSEGTPSEGTPSGGAAKASAADEETTYKVEALSNLEAYGAGGIAGYAEGCEVSGCQNTGAVSATYSKAALGLIGAGGLIGGVVNSSGSTTISKSFSVGAVSIDAGAIGMGGAGGMAGCVFNAATGDGDILKVEECQNTGAVTFRGAIGDAGGLVGQAYGAKVSGCRNAGKIGADVAQGGYAGGIAGEAGEAGKATITGSKNTGEVTANAGEAAGGYSLAGGIAGNVYGSATVTGCYNTGVVSASGSSSACYAGGMVGKAEISEITSCYNIGKINSSNCRGGIVGFVSSDPEKSKISKVTACYCLVGCAEKSIGIEGEGTEVKNVAALFIGEMRAEGLVEKLNKAIANKPTGVTAVFVLNAGHAPALWWEGVQSKEYDIGCTRSGVGGSVGFYKAIGGEITFKVVPNPGYKINKIISSGKDYLKPNSVVTKIPERVTVHFNKV